MSSRLRSVGQQISGAAQGMAVAAVSAASQMATVASMDPTAFFEAGPPPREIWLRDVLPSLAGKGSPRADGCRIARKLLKRQISHNGAIGKPAVGNIRNNVTISRLGFQLHWREQHGHGARRANGLGN